MSGGGGGGGGGGWWGWVNLFSCLVLVQAEQYLSWNKNKSISASYFMNHKM